MFCVKCGNEIPDDSLFCPFCGSRTINSADQAGSTVPEKEAQRAPQPAVQSESQPDPEKKLVSGAVVAIILMVFVAIIVILASYYGVPLPKDDGEHQYTAYNAFQIEGKWKNVGTTTFGQAQEGSIVVFDGTNCNLYSPADTYAFYHNGDSYQLDCTSAVFSENLTFYVYVIDENNIEIDTGGEKPLELTRVE